MTTLTDYLLGLEGLALGAWLGGLARRTRRLSAGLWSAAFAATGVAALMGGTSHGFAPQLGVSVKDGLWLVTYGLVGLGNLFILAGGAVVVARGSLRLALVAAIAARFVLYGAYLATHRDFRYVVYDYGVTLAALLIVALALRLRGRPGSGWVAAGVAVSALGAAAQRSGLAFHPHFNHNDLFHVVQMAGLYLFYRAGRLLADA